MPGVDPINLGSDFAEEVHSGLPEELTRQERASRWFVNKMNYEGEGIGSWFAHKATRLGEGGFQGAVGRMRTAAGGKTLAGGFAKTAGRGALSTFLPIEPFSIKQMNAMSKMGGLTGKVGGLAKTAGKGVLGQALKWLGPLILTYRLATEVPGNGFLGGADKAVRIVGEEVMQTTGAVIGGVIGTSVGGVVGAVAGMAIGYAIGAAGSWVWNKMVDAAEAPIRLANAGFKYFRDAGRRSADLELGGRVSQANSTGMAYTMRQRALSQMNRSGINARSLLGQEASYMHVR